MNYADIKIYNIAYIFTEPNLRLYLILNWKKIRDLNFQKISCTAQVSNKQKKTVQVLQFLKISFFTL